MENKELYIVGMVSIVCIVVMCAIYFAETNKLNNEIEKLNNELNSKNIELQQFKSFDLICINVNSSKDIIQLEQCYSHNEYNFTFINIAMIQ